MKNQTMIRASKMLHTINPKLESQILKTLAAHACSPNIVGIVDGMLDIIERSVRYKPRFRKLTKSYVDVLLALADKTIKLHESGRLGWTSGWVHRSRFGGDIHNDYPRLDKVWGLIDTDGKGCARINKNGLMFLRGELFVNQMALNRGGIAKNNYSKPTYSFSNRDGFVGISDYVHGSVDCKKLENAILEVTK